MAIGAITMILTNVGLQIYNNWCGSRQNDKLQQKRKEFECAARERNTEHMWNLLREGQKLTMELEEQKHKDRLKELKDELDNLLKEITHEQTIVNWPLKVLPIVMKNQAFGNLLANQEEKVAMHVLFARSNYSEFNKYVHPIIEKALELHCNQHWSTKSDHPILFYSGAWDTQRCPMNPNDVQITALQTQLSNLPTLLIIPFFRPKAGNKDGKLVFQVNMWGVGASKEYTFNVKEIEPKSDEFHFQRTYTNQQDYENEIGLVDEIVEDLVPYLECMIGYMADTYFWSSSGLAPHLPLLVTNGTINTDGMKYLISDSREYYDQLLLTSEEKAKENPFAENHLVSLFEGLSSLMKDDEIGTGLKRLFSEYCSTRKKVSYSSISSLVKDVDWGLTDLRFIAEVLNFADNHNISDYQELRPVKDMLTSINYDYSILDSKDIPRLEALVDAGEAAAMYRLGEIYEYGMRVPVDENKALRYYQQSAQKGFLFGKLKTGVIKYKDIDTKVETILRSMNILQLDILYSDEILSLNKSDDKINEAIGRLSQTIMSNIMTGRAYSHAGLLYNIASLKIKTKDYKTAMSMADLAMKLGYTKASNLIQSL